MLLVYQDEGRDLVARLKYRNARSALRWLAAALACRVGPAPDVVVTWVPTSAERRRRRGFDQAQLLAAAVAAELRRPCAALLTRDPGPPQTGRSLVQRRVGPSFRARARGRPPPERVLLVDDVVTTGSSLAAAARVLRRAGVASVDAAVVARTPLRNRGD
ncbi:MAG: ComF family protein [Acidimicrobiia bacterium]